MYVSAETLELYTGKVQKDKSLYDTYIGAAENLIENYLGYSLQSKAYVKYFDGANSLSICLSAKPVSACKIYINGTEKDITNYQITDEIIEAVKMENLFAEGYKNIKVEYTAGYKFEKDIVTGKIIVDEIPPIIKEIILEIASFKFDQSQGNVSISSKSFGDNGSRTFYKRPDFNDFLKQLEKYKLKNTNW